jgi:hypothetical protein
LTIALAGGFTTENNLSSGFIPARLLGRNVIALMSGTLRLFGVVQQGAQGGPRSLLLPVMRCAAFAITGAAVFRVILRLTGRETAPLFDRLLCAGTVSALAACVLSAQFAKGITPQNAWAGGGAATRYIMPAMLFGAVLAARQLPEMLGDLPSPRLRNALRGVLASFAVVTLFAGGSLSSAAAQPDWIARDPPTIAAGWLARHRLVEGVGEYWSANLITAMSGDEVRVRSVVATNGKLVPYVWVEDGRWYARAPQFVVWQDNNQTGLGFRDVRATYAICRLAIVAGYRIAILSEPPGRTSVCSGAHHFPREETHPKNGVPAVGSPDVIP